MITRYLAYSHFEGGPATQTQGILTYKPMQCGLQVHYESHCS